MEKDGLVFPTRITLRMRPHIEYQLLALTSSNSDLIFVHLGEEGYVFLLHKKMICAGGRLEELAQPLLLVDALTEDSPTKHYSRRSKKKTVKPEKMKKRGSTKKRKKREDEDEEEGTSEE